ncbi:hypothetical protein RRG08_029684 [Elysia crispata]|uniref:Uncharacterized protein n=1 Tax=Elysia crispata TaxID=231223 RepID=A0AAE1BDY4_9GAST|nr:hypothetical protein RRG08_029684 [Elysia crispata]
MTRTRRSAEWRLEAGDSSAKCDRDGLGLRYGASLEERAPSPSFLATTRLSALGIPWTWEMTAFIEVTTVFQVTEKPFTTHLTGIHYEILLKCEFINIEFDTAFKTVRKCYQLQNNDVFENYQKQCVSAIPEYEASSPEAEHPQREGTSVHIVNVPVINLIRPSCSSSAPRPGRARLYRVRRFPPPPQPSPRALHAPVLQSPTPPERLALAVLRERQRDSQGLQQDTYIPVYCTYQLKTVSLSSQRKVNLRGNVFHLRAGSFVSDPGLDTDSTASSEIVRLCGIYWQYWWIAK